MTNYTKEISTNEHTRETISFLNQLILDGKKYIVTVRRKIAKRSINQNALYWWWMECLEKLSESGYTKDEFHELFIEMFAPMVTKVLADNEITMRLRTSGMTTIQFNNHLEKIKMFSESELNVTLCYPDDENFDLWLESFREI